MSWLNLFKTIAAGRFRLIGDGHNHHHVADIADIVEGLVLCGSAAGIEGRTYILAGAESIRLRDLVQTIVEAVGAPALPANLPEGPFRLYEKASRELYSWIGCRLPRADRIDLYLGDRAFDLSRSRRELGYGPKVSTKEAVRRTAAWFLAFPTKLFLDVGGFNVSFPRSAGEDRELCDRWQYRGYRLIHAPEAVVYHAHHLTAKTFLRQHFYYGCGAYYYHLLRARQRQQPMKVESPVFYVNMLTYPFRKIPFGKAILVVPLLIAAQAVNAVGFFWERARGKKGMAGSRYPAI